MPRISVIIPTYNRSGVVGDAVSCVMTQTEADSEIIVVDDGSVDDTRAIVEDCGDDRVKYFYKTNGGPAGARNLGLSKARGEYVAFLDSDDTWPEDYVEIMLSRLESSSEFGAAYSAITMVNSDGTQVRSYKSPDGRSGWLTKDLFKRGFVWPSAAVFRSCVWQNHYFDELMPRTSEDSDAFLRLSMLTQFLFVPDVQAFHRMSSDSISADEGVACSRLLSLERFHFRLGGDKIVSAKAARCRLSHACRKIAEDRRRKTARNAALKLYKHALEYWPYDLRLYVGLVKSLLLDKDQDPEPDWEMPEPLGDPVGTNRFCESSRRTPL